MSTFIIFIFGGNQCFRPKNIFNMLESNVYFFLKLFCSCFPDTGCVGPKWFAAFRSRAIPPGIVLLLEWVHSFATGRVKVKTLPPPGLSSTQIRPPWARTIWLQMARPSPVPPGFPLAPDEGVVWNFLKMASLSP